MAPKAKDDGQAKRPMNRGAWTAEEDRKLAEYIETHGAKRWRTVATKSGLNRCGKSCRLRWLNYLRPNIKRGNISDEEEDLILRLHKLLGNRWSLIAGRLPGRTDNEIKNYWNSRLSKKISPKEKTPQASTPPETDITNQRNSEELEIAAKATENSDFNFNFSDFLDFSAEEPLNFEWLNLLILVSLIVP